MDAVEQAIARDKYSNMLLGVPIQQWSNVRTLAHMHGWDGIMPIDQFLRARMGKPTIPVQVGSR